MRQGKFKNLLFPADKFLKTRVTEHIVNNQTGEVIPVKGKTKVGMRDFICMFLNAGQCVELYKGIDLAFVYALLCRTTYLTEDNDYNGNVVNLHKTRKQAVADMLGISVRQFDRTFRKLLDRRMLVRVDEAMYQFNPVFFAKGKSSDIIKLAASDMYSDMNMYRNNGKEETLKQSESEKRNAAVFFENEEKNGDDRERDGQKGI